MKTEQFSSFVMGLTADNNQLDEIDSLVNRCQAEKEDGFGVVNSDDDESIDSDEADGRSG
ncbi:hypothetical protein KEM48_002647 [Puccinia striiformis f. sp. tritici PST-130]|nr:hypothetical protein KEM48_002647 [Puccinia striiformis f. sp. tritici PST-130]